MPRKFSRRKYFYEKFVSLFLSLIFFLNAAVFSQTAPETQISGGAADSQKRAETFDEIWSLINEKYYDANFNGVDWKAVRGRFRRQIETAHGEKDFYALLDRMVGELRDSHTRVFSPAERERRKMRLTASVGITVRRVEDAPTVFSVAPDSPAARAGIKPGMIVRAIDDEPIDNLISVARRAVGVSSSERATEMRVFSKILSGEADSLMKIELATASGDALKTVLPRAALSSTPKIETRRLDSGAAYLKISQFDELIAAPTAEALRKFRDAPALILDLRGNAGGDGEIGLKIAGFFINEEITVARLLTRNGKPPLPEIPLILRAGGAGSRIFSPPLVILIDESSASTSELIANALRENRRAKIIGARSCGCVLGFLDYKKLKHGGEMSFSEFGFVTARGRRLERSGVVPDQKIAVKRKDLLNDYDAALAAAETYLKNIRRNIK